MDSFDRRCKPCYEYLGAYWYGETHANGVPRFMPMSSAQSFHEQVLLVDSTQHYVPGGLAFTRTT